MKPITFTVLSAVSVTTDTCSSLSDQIELRSQAWLRTYMRTYCTPCVGGPTRARHLRSTWSAIYRNYFAQSVLERLSRPVRLRGSGRAFGFARVTVSRVPHGRVALRLRYCADY
jgi:hypothetical protein